LDELVAEEESGLKSEVIASVEPIEKPAFEVGALDELVAEEESGLKSEVIASVEPIEKPASEVGALDELVAEEESGVKSDSSEKVLVAEKMPMQQVEKEDRKGKVRDERPLKEIDVNDLNIRLNEEPSKEKLPLEKGGHSVSQKALEEVLVVKRIEDIKAEKEMMKTKNEYDGNVSLAEKTATKEEKGEKVAEMNERLPIGSIVRGYSYVQIGVFGNAVRVEELLKKYGNSYPIVIERRGGAGKANYAVFVGPLQKDEVGAVQESFRSFGFKDAF